MRYIDLSTLSRALPVNWETRAANALTELTTADPSERASIIDKYSQLWREIAPLLGSLSYKKCWYCESREKRSDKSVDHFRPKRAPIESPGHPGYWWLTFQWENYRYCCTYCNEKRVDRLNTTSGGKGSHFPLVDENARAMNDAELRAETPVLLDPTTQTDVTLLYFDESGAARPRPEASLQPILYNRASVSVRFYHLDHVDLTEARREVFREIKALVARGFTFYSEWNAGNQSSQEGFEFVINQLRKMVNLESEYSAAARDAILGLRDDKHPWLGGVF